MVTLMTFVACLVAAWVVAPTAALQVYVAPLCDFDVPPPCGADANPGTEAKPFASLHKARDALRLAP